MYLRIAAAIVMAVACAAASVQADLTVAYRATKAELVLFDQPQEPPFARMQYTLYLSGPNVRTEMIDAFGRAWWYLADRETGKAYMLDPAKKQYWADRGAWKCAGMVSAVAAEIRRLMVQSGASELAVSPMDDDSVAGVATTGAAVQFTGRVLGLPQPMASELDLYFPRSEEEAFGSKSAGDLYCGQRPSAETWTTALQKQVGLDPGAAAFLGKVITVPIRLELRVNASVGRAALTLDAAEISHNPIDPALFDIPADFTERQ